MRRRLRIKRDGVSDSAVCSSGSCAGEGMQKRKKREKMGTADTGCTHFAQQCLGHHRVSVKAIGGSPFGTIDKIQKK